jgi:hypothetical protein
MSTPEPVLSALLEFVRTHEGYWIGGGAELLFALTALVPETTSRMRAWPANAQTLSNRLTEGEAWLGRHGVEFRRGKSGGKRFIELWNKPPRLSWSRRLVRNTRRCR